MVTRYNAVYDIDPKFFTHLSNYLSGSLLKLIRQYLVSILRDPNDVISMAVYCMRGFAVDRHRTCDAIASRRDSQTKVFPSEDGGFQPSMRL